eukprot:m.552298 g.552298  ORF g.552298 m.552298 type:complete len:85 (-) comp57740_c1_seq9:43-297(-)
MSAWNAPTIGAFPNPSISLFDKRNPTVQLCPSFSLSESRHSQAVIMCHVCHGTAGWEVLASGQNSSGNAKNYDAIQAILGALQS